MYVETHNGNKETHGMERRNAQGEWEMHISQSGTHRAHTCTTFMISEMITPTTLF